MPRLIRSIRAYRKHARVARPSSRWAIAIFTSAPTARRLAGANTTDLSANGCSKVDSSIDKRATGAPKRTISASIN